MTTSTDPDATPPVCGDQTRDVDDAAARLAARARRYMGLAATEKSGRQEAVCFRRKETSYAISLQALREIRRFTNPCRLPGARRVVAGMIHYRGVLVSVHDLEGLLRPDQDAEMGGWVVIVEHGGELFGLLADEVNGTRAFGEEDVRPLPVTFPTASHVFRGLLGGLLLLQPNLLFSDERFISAY